MSAYNATFEGTYAQFIEELKLTFPEYADGLNGVSCEDAKTHFHTFWKKHAHSIATKDASIFNASGVEIVPGFRMHSKLWSELSPATHEAIWKYIGSLLLLITTKDDFSMDGFAESMQSMMEHLKSFGNDTTFQSMFEKLGKMAESFGDASTKFKIPERLFKGHIAKIAEELVKDFKPEDFGLSPEMLENTDPKWVFHYLQEIFTKKPELLMASAQKIANKLKTKLMNGSIKKEEIIREAEELMKEFADNEMFSELFGGLGDMLKSSEKETGNEGSARRREVQERLRRKAEAKKAGKDATSNTIVSSDAVAAAEAAAFALLMEEDAKTTSKKGKRK